MNYLSKCLLASLAAVTSAACMEKSNEGKVAKLKDLLIDQIIKRGISVPESTPEDIKDALKEKMVAGCEKINFINIVDKMRTPPQKIASFPKNVCITALSPNGKRMLVFEGMGDLAVYTTQKEKLCSIPRHCDCLTPPLHAFSNEGAYLVLARYCSKTESGMIEIVTPDSADTQIIPVGNVLIESLAVNEKRSLIAYAGGCSSHIQFYQRLNHTAPFEKIAAFGVGHLIALNKEGTKAAAAHHGDLLIYDISDLANPSELYRVYAHQIPSLQFCTHSDAVIIPVRNEQKSLLPIEAEEHIVFASLCEGIIFSSLAMSNDGNKLICLVNGTPRFTYMADPQTKQLELPMQEKYLLACLHDEDTALTVCTHHDVYQYDLTKLKLFETRFAKSIKDMAVDDVPVALALQSMAAQEYQNCAQGKVPEQQNMFVNQAIEKLFSVPEHTPQKSFVQSIQLPLLGMAGLLFAVCVFSN